ncbi:hypothetical protein [Draconibacterium halophilum]|uniref:Uncharacterized protein n=1 Tax=Draconibacterium halophilum TaxID=2706887 RepID=A0A6C0RFG5_9BACT|nr:hypothetical protein [Draconibacterium halophilum]QIA08889.1 hypothetical protein G0Q07_14700 [Draconibacterium halophilum]
MKSLSKLIHESSMTFLPTHYPVHFYGLPDGKVYLCFARFYEAGFNNTDLEFVFARHNDFRYNHKEEVIIPKAEFRAPVYNEMVDNPDPDITVLEVRRDIQSYTEAVNYIDSLNLTNSILNSGIENTEQVA